VNSTTVLIVVVIVVVVAVALAVARSRRANDGVDSFRRQIDALSPEARRPVVDQVQSAKGRNDPGDDAPDDDDERPDDEDGARGT
jgi:hypothetical protein